MRSTLMHLYVRAQSRLGARDDRGQASAEYALVLIGAAGVALLVAAWAKDTDKVGDLLDGVFDHVLGRAR